MSGMADRDHEITSSILRSWQQPLELCIQLAAGYRAAGDVANADYYDQAAVRYRQAIDGARDAWADADRLPVLRAIIAADADAETLWCPTPAAEEVTHVH